MCSHSLGFEDIATVDLECTKPKTDLNLDSLEQTANSQRAGDPVVLIS